MDAKQCEELARLVAAAIATDRACDEADRAELEQLAEDGPDDDVVDAAEAASRADIAARAALLDAMWALARRTDDDIAVQLADGSLAVRTAQSDGLAVVAADRVVRLGDGGGPAATGDYRPYRAVGEARPGPVTTAELRALAERARACGQDRLADAIEIAGPPNVSP